MKTGKDIFHSLVTVKLILVLIGNIRRDTASNLYECYQLNGLQSNHNDWLMRSREGKYQMHCFHKGSSSMVLSLMDVADWGYKKFQY